jgi:hypothetical protein
MGNGTISANDLMSKLVGARKVMNKVESGNYETGFVDQNLLSEGDDTYISEGDDEVILPTEPKPNVRPVGTPNLDKINQSKLPDAIKRAMIESPIPTAPEISLNDTLDMDFIKGAKRLMEQEGLSTKKQTAPQRNAPIQRQTQSNTGSLNSAEIVALIKPIVENTVRQTISEILDKKLDQILKAQQSVAINENLMIKVGDSVFSGKLTKVNNAKGK